MLLERIFLASIWLGQRFPHPLRVLLTRSSAVAWLRRISLMTKGGSVVVKLDGPLAGYRMQLDMRAGHRRYALGTYEQEIATLIESLLIGGETVMDIGANVGYFTLLMARQVGPNGRVIAFEPYPPVYTMLRENLRLNGLNWVQAECRAVASEEGELQMQSEANNLLSFTVRLFESGDLTVPAISIDRYVESAGLKRLDFVKIDVEGAEDAVIRGMAKTLRSLMPMVLVEIHANNGCKSESLMHLQEVGYELKKVDRTGLVPFDTTAQVGHVLGKWRA